MNGRKVLLLGILLLLPVLAFLFLQSFGRNAYKLRTYLPEPVGTARVGAPPVSGAPAAATGDTVFHRVSDSVLLRTGAAGQPFHPPTELRDRIVVLGFGRPGATEPIDRAVTRGLARVQERYRAQPLVKLLVVAPEPAPNLAALAERAGAISGKWTFATAAPGALRHLRTELRDSAALANPNAPTRLWLLDKQRYLRGIYDPTDPREIDRLLTEVGVLLKIVQNPARP